jgi:hypothetical protein
MSSCWKNAMRDEFQALEGNHTWDLLPQPSNETRNSIFKGLDHIYIYKNKNQTNKYKKKRLFFLIIFFLEVELSVRPICTLLEVNGSSLSS